MGRATGAAIYRGDRAYERKEFDRIAQLVRDARHDTIDAMRADLDLHGSAKPPCGEALRTGGR